MAEFINTIDVLGDDAVIDSIIDRTITEFKDDQVMKVGTYAFYKCTALTEVDLPNVTNIGDYAFNGCQSLATVCFSNCSTIGNNAFEGCAKLDELTEENFPSLTSVGSNAFKSTKIKKVSLPLLTTIAQFAFPSLTSITEIRLPSAKVLNGAFGGCYGNIKLVDLPVCTEIKLKAFNACPNIANFVLRSETLCTIDSYTAVCGFNYNYWTNTKIFVPRALVEDYKVATNWSVYADFFYALEDYTVDGTITGELDETKI